MNPDSEITLAIVEMVADRKGVDPIELPPLYEVADPDALERVLAESETEALSIQFGYAGYRVRIESAEETIIVVEPASATTSTDGVCGSPS
ncbi:HalOD1 output domain-containing protein [Halovivax sp.]|uniref:HalOD1 output domain-containing protein n=1 Tax=Halovivax sp. TaxID=1935978 RepID=UPI0025BFBE23|nr:HalOD1 output domain-containing protein [Halovivax sp.]